MMKIAILGAAMMLAAAPSTPSHAAPQPTAGAVLRLADGIPPNCTMDPFTGKMNCPIPPSCTINPWTGKMTCRRTNRAVMTVM